MSPYEKRPFIASAEPVHKSFQETNLRLLMQLVGACAWWCNSRVNRVGLSLLEPLPKSLLMTINRS
jgi:hypothetical protein